MIGPTDRDQQCAPRRVVADALNNGAAVDVAALERSKVDGAPSSHIDRFGRDGRGEKAQEKCGGGADHDVRRLKHDPEKCEAVFRKDHARTMSVATSRHDTSLDIPVKVALTTAKYDVLALQAR